MRGILLFGLLVMMMNDATMAQATRAGSYTPRTLVTIRGQQWLMNGRVVHEGSPAEGLLTNVRMVNAVFEDAGEAGKRHLPAGFDPQENTRQFIEQIPAYVGSGVSAFTISLQGGSPGYEGAINSAFNADGTLRDPYMSRVAQVIEACDQAGAAVILTCFYQRQHSHDRALAGREGIRSAVVNVARWVRERGYENVVLEISNEYRHNGFARWEDGQWLRSDEGQVELMRVARRAAPGLLVSTSGMGDGRISEAIAREADFVLIHFNNTALADIQARLADARQYSKPVVCNEDAKVGQAGAEACRLAIVNGAGWGLMHSAKNQDAPFEFDGPADDPEVYAMLRRVTSPAGGAEALSDRPVGGVSVLITEPKDGDTFATGQAIRMVAAVTVPAGTKPARVVFYANGRQVGSASSAPWKVTWKADAPGGYDLVAEVFDADGTRIARSREVDIVVSGATTQRAQ